MDLHCHLGLYDNPIEIAQEAEKAGIITFSMTNLPSEFEALYFQFRNFKRVRLALGLHPLMADQHRSYMSMFERLVSQTSYIGEVGLDFSEYGKSTKDMQVKSFRFVLSCIQNQSKVISVHSRNAELAVLELLEEFKISNAILHWYSGPLKVLNKAINQGCYFSINTSMIKSKNGISIIEHIPKSNVLLETDGPFIKVKNRPVTPVDTHQIIIALQSLWNMSEDQVKTQLRSNFQLLIQPLKT